MFKSRVFIFILLALAAFMLQLIINKGQLSGPQCCPKAAPDLLIGYPSQRDPGSSR